MEHTASVQGTGPFAQTRSSHVATGFLDGLKEHARTVTALILREMHTRFGEARAGYLWGIIEPGIHAISLTFILSYLGHAAPLGGSSELFIFTAVISFFLFRDVESRIGSAFRANRGLMYFPVVKPLDVIVARFVLEVLTWLTVAAIMMGGLALLGYDVRPADPLTVVEGLLALALLGLGLGLVSAVINEFTVVWDKTLHVIMRPVYLLSGIVFIPSEVPSSLQFIIDWLPTTHGVDWVRTGFYDGYESDFLDKGFVLLTGLVLLALGLVLERVTRPWRETE